MRHSVWKIYIPMVVASSMLHHLQDLLQPMPEFCWHSWFFLVFFTTQIRLTTYLIPKWYLLCLVLFASSWFVGEIVLSQTLLWPCSPVLWMPWRGLVKAVPHYCLDRAKTFTSRGTWCSMHSAFLNICTKVVTFLDIRRLLFELSLFVYHVV